MSYGPNFTEIIAGAYFVDRIVKGAVRRPAGGAADSWW
jgi:hypothetical protein